MVKLDGNAFSGMSPVLQELILTHNNLTEIPSEALAEAKTLLKLDLSNNTIGDLTAEHAIPALPKLYDLNLAYNKICNVHKNALSGVRDNVQTINFGHNCLAAVPAPAIRGFKQLQALHMHHNEIGALDALSFMNLPVMNLLNLAANKITEIKQQAFLNVPVLRYLYLTDNSIEVLASHQFAGFEQLEMLDLTRNNIETVPKMAFAGLGQLRQLYLGENHISTIETDAFANSTVAILILASNNLTSLDEGSLNGLPNLQQISLKNNHISSIHQNAFYNTPSAAMVDLSGNEITDLPSSLFLTQLNLLLIDLSRNKITKTPYSSFNRRVGTVLLQENPLVCTEKVHMLQDGVGVYIPNSDDIICGGHPKPSTMTTTTTEKTVIEEEQQEQVPMARTSETSAERRADPIYSRLGIQGLPPQRLKEPVDIPKPPAVAFQQEEEVLQQQLQQPIRPVNADGSRPSILNVRPANIVSRPRNHFGSELASGRLPSRENPFARTAVHVPSSQITTTTVEPEEEPSIIVPAEIPLPREEIKAVKAEEIKEIKEQIEDEALNKMIDVMSLPPTTTDAPGPRTTTDIRDNPNIIHPFPVPFLKRGPNLSSSSIIRPSTAASPDEPLPHSTAYPHIDPLEPIADLAAPSVQSPFPIPALEEPTVPMHTLPPSIVLAPVRPPPEIKNNKIESEHYTEFAMRTQPPVEISRDAAEKNAARSAGFVTPGLLISVCLALVFLASIIVFVCLCVAKHKNMRRSCRLGSSAESDSTTARTNAYVAAQQAQMKMMYGTMSRSRQARA
ncbi:hypothetical protein PMAYCL1PPCAC_31218, partial [Pristionchus mayeri]